MSDRLPLILAIDPAISCGWALGDWGAGASGLIDSGTWKLASSSDHPGERYSTLWWNLVKSDSHSPPALLVYETGFHRGLPATRSHWGLVGVLMAFAATHRIEVMELKPSTLKAHAGHGGADKAWMMKIARATFGRAPATNDEADAWLLYDYARRHWNGPKTETTGATHERISKDQAADGVRAYRA